MSNNTNITAIGNTGAPDDADDAEMKEITSKNAQEVEEDTEMKNANNVENVSSSSNKNGNINENVTSISDATSMETETKTEQKEPEYRTTLNSLKDEALPSINGGFYLFSPQDSTPTDFDKKIAEEIEAIMNGTHKDFIEKSNMLKQLMEERIAITEKWRDIQIQNIINICNADIQQAQNDYNVSVIYYLLSYSQVCLFIYLCWNAFIDCTIE